MASYIYTTNGSSQLSDQIGTDKVRISTSTSAVAIAIGDANVVANLSSCEIVPASTVLNSVIVGEGNYIAYINVAGAAGAFSVTELGMPIGS